MSHTSATIFNEYRKKIALYCDDVMLQSNSSWRHRHYCDDLNIMLAISHKQQIKRSSGNSPVNPRLRLSVAPAFKNQQLSHPLPDSSSVLPPAAAKDTLLRCKVCNTPFSGTNRNQTRNLKRHFVTVHDKRSRAACPELDCDKIFSRLDNLKAHRRRFHGLF